MSLLRTLIMVPLGLYAPAIGNPQDVLRAQDRALATLSTDRISADLDWIASPDRTGRATPSQGLDETAAYIGKRLETLGAKPAGSDGFRAPYPLSYLGVNSEQSGTSISTATQSIELGFGSGIYPERLGQLAGWDLEGPLVSLGAGEEADVVGTALRGAWALVQEGTTPTRGAVLRAMEAGAIGVVITPGPTCPRPDYRQRFEAVTRSMVRGLVTQVPPRPNRHAIHPVLMLDEKGAQQILALSPVDWPDRSNQALPPSGLNLGLQFHDRRILADPITHADNVTALFPGTDLAQEVIVLCAHMDHMGEVRGAIYPGANDNASGVAALLAIGEGLKARGPGRRSIALVFLSGAEKGSWGAQAWLAHPLLPPGYQPAAVINFDRVGRLENQQLFATPSPSHSHFNPVAAAAAGPVRAEDLVLGSLDDQWHRLDTRVFADAEIPVLTLSTGVDEDTHTATDTRDKIHADSVHQVARVGLRLLEELDGELLGQRLHVSILDGQGPGPPDREAALAMGRDLIHAADTGHLDGFFDALDRRALVQRAIDLSGAAATPAQRAWLSQALELEHLWRRTVELCTEDGQYSVLSVTCTAATQTSPAETQLNMRVARETDFDYHRLRLDRDSTGSLRIVDLYALSLGEWASQTLARHHAMILADVDSCADIRAGRAPRCLVPLTVLHECYDEPQLDRGMAALNALPQRLRSARDYSRMGMLYTWGPRRKDWAVARGEFEAAFPTAQGPVVWAVCDTHGWDPEPAELHEALDAMEAISGDSTYPTFLRGFHAMAASDPAGAKSHYERALSLDPEFQESWWGKLEALKALEDWPGLARHMQQFGDYFEFEFTDEDLLKDATLSEFVASEAFRQWRSGDQPNH